MWLPAAKTMIVCEDVLPGPEHTGNVHLMNVFSGIKPKGNPPFPHRQPRFAFSFSSPITRERVLAGSWSAEPTTWTTLFSPESITTFNSKIGCK